MAQQREAVGDPYASDDTPVQVEALDRQDGSNDVERYAYWRVRDSGSVYAVHLVNGQVVGMSGALEGNDYRMYPPQAFIRFTDTDGSLLKYANKVAAWFHEVD